MRSRMRKNRIAAAAAAALAAMISFPLSAAAETFYGEEGWQVVFDGERMESTFTNAQIDDTIYQMQPGDTAEIHLGLRNECSEDTWWYMTNEVLRTLEESQDVAEGGAYSYHLTYRGPDGEEDVLYSSEHVGGDTVNESGEGLHQATDSLEDYFYLDTLAEGETGEVCLQVHLEGETQGNEYQNTLARLQMNFAVELAQADTPPGGDTPGSTDIVRTGDTSRAMAWSVISLTAGLFILCFALIRILGGRRKEEDAAAAQGTVGNAQAGRRRKGDGQ